MTDIHEKFKRMLEDNGIAVVTRARLEELENAAKAGAALAEEIEQTAAWYRDALRDNARLREKVRELEAELDRLEAELDSATIRGRELVEQAETYAQIAETRVVNQERRIAELEVAVGEANKRALDNLEYLKHAQTRIRQVEEKVRELEAEQTKLLELNTAQGETIRKLEADLSVAREERSDLEAELPGLREPARRYDELDRLWRAGGPEWAHGKLAELEAEREHFKRELREAQEKSLDRAAKIERLEAERDELGELVNQAGESAAAWQQSGKLALKDIAELQAKLDRITAERDQLWKDRGTWQAQLDASKALAADAKAVIQLLAREGVRASMEEWNRIKPWLTEDVRQKPATAAELAAKHGFKEHGGEPDALASAQPAANAVIREYPDRDAADKAMRETVVGQDTAFDPALSPGHTDLMVPPETIDPHLKLAELQNAARRLLRLGGSSAPAPEYYDALQALEDLLPPSAERAGLSSKEEP